MNTTSLSRLSADDLVANLLSLLGEERRTALTFTRHLAELIRRKVHLDRGYSSAFTFCLEALKLPKSESWRRSTAAQLLLRFPVIDEYLADGRLSVSTLVALHKVLEPESHRATLDRAAGLTLEQVDDLVLLLAPKPDVNSSLRAAPVRAPALPPAAPKLDATPSPGPTLSLLDAPPPPSCSEAAAPSAPPAKPLPPVRKDERLNEKSWLVTLCLPKELRDDLEEARDLLSHKFPDRDLVQVFGECLRLSLETLRKKKVGAKKRGSKMELPDSASSTATSTGTVAAPPAAESASPAGSNLEPATSSSASAAVASSSASSGSKMEPTSAAPSRYVDVETRRRVWERDEGQCAWVGPDGHRCRSTHQLEFDHVEPFSLGGSSTVDVLRLLCRSHNQHHARRVFGDAFMSRFTG